MLPNCYFSEVDNENKTVTTPSGRFVCSTVAVDLPGTS